MRPNSFHLRVVEGSSHERERLLFEGDANGALSLGTSGAWRVSAPGVAPVHVWMALRGAMLMVRAHEANRALLNGQPLGSTWVGVTTFAHLVFGEARVSISPRGTSRPTGSASKEARTVSLDDDERITALRRRLCADAIRSDDDTIVPRLELDNAHATAFGSVPVLGRPSSDGDTLQLDDHQHEAAHRTVTAASSSPSSLPLDPYRTTIMGMSNAGPAAERERAPVPGERATANPGSPPPQRPLAPVPSPPFTHASAPPLPPVPSLPFAPAKGEIAFASRVRPEPTSLPPRSVTAMSRFEPSVRPPMTPSPAVASARPGSPGPGTQVHAQSAAPASAVWISARSSSADGPSPPTQASFTIPASQAIYSVLPAGAPTMARPHVAPSVAVPQANRASVPVAAPGKPHLHALRAAWTSAPPIRKLTIVAALPALLAVCFLLWQPRAQASPNHGLPAPPTAVAAAASTSLTTAPPTAVAAAPSSSGIPSPVPSAPSPRTTGDSAPRIASSLRSAAAAAGAGRKTPERVALDAAAEGSFDVAAERYAELASRHPDNPGFSEAVRILREKATRPQPR